MVDNIFINTLYNPINGNFLENLSYDHLPNFIIIESKSSKNRNMKVKTRHPKNSNQEYSDELYDPNLTLELTNTHNANLAYNIFHKRFQFLLNKHAPLRFLSRKEVKLKRKPWVTKGILKSIKVKRNLLKFFKKTSNQETFLEYKLHRKTLNIFRKNSKNMYYKQYFENNI